MSFRGIVFGLVCAMTMAMVGSAQQPGLLTDPSILANAHSIPFHPVPHDLTNGQAHSRFGIFGIDSIPNFNGQYFATGFDYFGNPNATGIQTRSAIRRRWVERPSLALRFSPSTWNSMTPTAISG